jgi:CHAD domain-containing protein
MSSLKREEGLRKGLQRISEKRLQDVLEAANHEGLTAKPVHEIRRTIKSLRATLRLTRGALNVEARKARNQALKDLAGRFSGPRDAAVVLSAFKKAYREILNGDNAESQPPWVSQLQKSLASRANALIPAESYQDAVDAVRCLKGQILSFQVSDDQGKPAQPGFKSEWEKTAQEGLRKTYSQGRRLTRQIATTPEPSDEQWHELRKRAKDLGYQLSLLKKLKGVKPLLARLDKLGNALGDARDLCLLRDYLSKAQDKTELLFPEQASFQRLLTYIDQRRQDLYQGELKAAKRVYRRGKKRFMRWMERRWHRWEGMGS